MHTHQFFTWTTHTAENTTLLDYKKLYNYMCNIVTEFYLYSIVYRYLINSRLDVTHSVRHHFRIANFIMVSEVGFKPMPALLGNQSMQGNEKNMDTGIYIREHYSEQIPYAQHTHTQGEFHRTSNN